ncbi:MAG TPA: 3'-5' exonuclease [Streptosporangiaceae bacterium]|jgi:DNA helicase IV|nr:3'-5' exonuclease [Streptosporangiaceae bacterium]
MLYGLLDRARQRSEAMLREVHGRGGAGGTFAARIEREVAASEQARRLAQLNGVERGLCFGRMDDTASNTFYIGRIGLHDDEYEPVLIDWRAPAARPFYAATPNDPAGLLRRRHLYTRGRAVVGLDDEVFDLDRMSEADRRGLVGEGMLLAAIRRGRTGRMADVVATIQAEQDRVIRSALAGVLVVQGGPGTGKTVAALHRAAFLLYTHRRTLERRGVLIVGPNVTFLRYISQVLPSLGETDVVLASLGELFPGVRATAEDSPEAAVVKGDLRMVKVLRAAVQDRQRVPRGGLEVVAGDVTLEVPAEACERARARARSLRKPHNVARKLFVTEMLDALARSEAEALGRPSSDLDEGDLPYIRARLWDEEPVRKALDELWPFLTPQQLLAGLLGEEGTLRRAAADLDEAERGVLLRSGRAGEWTVADVPLLDEAAELLGADDSAEKAMRRAAEREQRAEERYAEGVLEITGLAGQGFVDAATIAGRHRDTGPELTTAERAAADRSWAYGHVIIDEAQELSAMAWRMVMRRVPTKSLTVVGDVAQTGNAAGARSWGEMLDRYVKGRWREERLTVNYRTPAEIMTVAAGVLAAVAPAERPPESVREEGEKPRALRAGPDGAGAAAAGSADRERLAAGVARVVEAEAAELAASGEGRLAVIAPGSRMAELAMAIPHAVPGGRAEALDSPVALLTVAQAKGLEFDRVVLADPAGIIAQSPKGGHDLYVAITRATHRLAVVYEGELPPLLAALRK